MKRAHDATSAAATRGSDANAPWPKRMATEVTATIATSSRYGFGFRGSLSAKGTNAAAISDNNQSEGGDSSAATANATATKEETPEIPTTTSKESSQVLDVVEANESTRGRGRLTARERSLTRPNVRKASVGATSGLPIPAPRSTSRILLKQEPTIGMGTRRASVTVPSIQSSSLVRRASEQSPMRLKRDVEGGKENSDPVANSAERAIEAFGAFLVATLTSERDVEAETLLQARLKAKKFDMKARCEEMQNTVRQAKVVVRAMLDDRMAVRTQWSTACTKTLAELRAEEQRRKRLQAQMTEKTLQLSRVDQEMESLRRLTDGADTRVRDLTEQNKHHVETQEHLKRVRAELEAANQRLQAQLQQAQKQNDELTLELRSYQTTMSDRVQLYEEKKKELEQFYQRKETEEEKRKSSENEHLHARLIELKEEMATANQEKETYRERFFSAEEETRRERDRSAQIEREKCTIEAQYRSLEDRLGQSSTEMSHMKAKIDQKEQEISGLVQSLTEIQKLNAVSSSKIDTEKKGLTEKIDQLQSQLRDAERNEATNSALMRELRGRAEAYASAKSGWDEKQREFESRIKEVEVQLQTSARDLSVETGVRQMLESQNRELRNETTAVNAQTEALRFEMKRLSSKHEEAKAVWQAQLASADERLDTEKAALQRQIDVLHEEKVSIESEVKTLRERAANVRDGDFEELCNVKREAEVLRLRLQEMSNHGSQSMAQKDRLIEELQEKIRQGEKTRRMLHNTIQELRGNVRVFARTRPFLPSDGARDTESLTPAVSCEFDGQTVKLRRQGKGSSSNEQDTHSFSFDKVFAPSSGQDNIFEEVSEFVQSAIDGYHVCLFSYGQTGSGKTHTMQGSGNGQMRGIIPRSIEKVLAECTLLKDHGWSYMMKVSFLEIYNETLKDLLVTKEDANKTLSIKKDAKGGVCVPDLTLVEVTEMQQVEKLMERASRARSVACTEMNAQSSRSHSVFTLHLQGVNDSEGIMLDGQLNLVDLAGSERASRSGVSGERLKETQAINKSLSCLADVFTAIGNKSAHIPFRNSKLTYLLQTSLSGDGKTLMMVNVSPTLESAGETLCSLRFAQQVNKCELGKPKRQIKSKKDA